jgi:hypothetical protein
VSKNIPGPSGIPGRIGDAFGIISGIFGLLNSPQEQETFIDPTALGASVAKAAKDMFNKATKILDGLNSELFGKDSPDITLEDVVSRISQSRGETFDPNKESAIVKLFGGGAFLTDQGIEDASTAIQAGLAQERVGLVAAALRAIEAFVFVNRDQKESDCVFPGSRFLGGECYTLAIRTDESKNQGASFIRQSSAALLDSKYGISLEQFYTNINECQNGQAADLTAGFNGDFPPCYFGLPIAKTNGEDVCNIFDKGEHESLPASLKLNDQDCPIEEGRLKEIFPNPQG